MLFRSEGSYTVNVTATGEWQATVTDGADSWLTLSKNSAVGSGDLRLFFSANTDNGRRSGRVVVTMTSGQHTAQQEIMVEQLGMDPDIMLDYSTEMIPFTGNTLVCQVISNTDWAIEIAEQYNWIESEAAEAATRAFVTDDVSFRISPNFGAQRTGQVVVKSTGNYVLRRTLEITQEMIRNSMDIVQDEYIVPWRCNALPIEIVQNYPIEYTIVSDEAWVNLDRDASTDEWVVLSLDDNTSTLPRTAMVTIKNQVQERTVEVFQYGRPDTSIGDDPSAGQRMAVHGAEGGGRFTTGGRGSEIYKGTTLEDYGANEAMIPRS